MYFVRMEGVILFPVDFAIDPCCGYHDACKNVVVDHDVRHHLTNCLRLHQNKLDLDQCRSVL